jgi:hypothetical protein
MDSSITDGSRAERVLRDAGSVSHPEVRMEGNGGAERDRTAGLLVANEALSQLSYSPTDSE